MCKKEEKRNLYVLTYKYYANQFYPDMISLRNENKHQITRMIYIELKKMFLD